MKKKRIKIRRKKGLRAATPSLSSISLAAPFVSKYLHLFCSKRLFYQLCVHVLLLLYCHQRATIFFGMSERKYRKICHRDKQRKIFLENVIFELFITIAQVRVGLADRRTLWVTLMAAYLQNYHARILFFSFCNIYLCFLNQHYFILTNETDTTGRKFSAAWGVIQYLSYIK
jgi:hypothetical protein